MAQTGSRKRGRVATNSIDSEQRNTRKKPGTAKTTRSTKGHTSNKSLGRNDSLQTAIRATKQGCKGASDALEKIRAKGNEVSLVIEEEWRRVNDGRGSRTDEDPADSLTVEHALHSHDPLAGCEAFEEAKRALQRLQSLAARYDAIGDQDAGLTEPRWMRWKQDVLDLHALNTKAKTLACRITESHLAPTGWPELAGLQAAGEDQELAQIALEILDGALPKRAATWGSAAAQLIDVYGSILKDTFK
ncbi:hypothetical protein PWT90_04356 [Aphanocladium album]|nr:hypothetical protein PWT90_04356 [Aphanocladium album]